MAHLWCSLLKDTSELGVSKYGVWVVQETYQIGVNLYLTGTRFESLSGDDYLHRLFHGCPQFFKTNFGTLNGSFIIASFQIVNSS
jgi:hypothetical protein